ncbi:MAG: thioredoxin family protein [Vicingaceae bacterium]
MDWKNLIEKAHSFTYQEYVDYVQKLYDENKVTGAEQSEAKLEATKINLSRMNRIYKTTNIDEKIINCINSKNVEQNWVLIVEGWCGDSAQVTPIIAKLADAFKDKINLRLILRDVNEEIMNHFLTNGARAIPKLIVFDKDFKNVLATWGARPEKIQKMVVDYKNSNETFDKDEFNKALHTWYAKDKGQAMFEDLLNLCMQQQTPEMV